MILHLVHVGYIHAPRKSIKILAISNELIKID